MTTNPVSWINKYCVVRRIQSRAGRARAFIPLPHLDDEPGLPEGGEWVDRPASCCGRVAPSRGQL